jgi:hypothetical protein
MLSVVFHFYYVDCHCAECYAECLFADCHGAGVGVGGISCQCCKAFFFVTDELNRQA